MRYWLIAVLALITSNICQSQTWLYFSCQDIPVNIGCSSGGIGAYVNPNADPELFSLNTSDSTNAWVFTETDKPFGQSQDTVLGWVTDSITPYSAGLYSEMVLKAPYDHGEAVTWLIFEHRYETDSLQDGGYIQISCDSLNWNTVNLNEWNQNIPQQVITENYGSSFLDDSIPAFTGSSGDWIESWIGINWYISVVQEDENRDYTGCTWDNFDTLYYKFVFESDSNGVGHGGWQIRNMMIGAHDQPGSVAEPEPEPLIVYPNPAKNLLSIRIPESAGKPLKTMLYDMQGRLMMTERFESKLDVSSVKSGRYLILVQTEKRQLRSFVHIEK